MSAETGASGSILQNVADAAEEFVEKMTDTESPPNESNGEKSEGKLTMEERKAKMAQLRKKLRSSEQANRAAVVEESAKAKIGAREGARLERQRQLAEVLRQKADAEERGEDVERLKNWEYTIEENDEWEKKKARKSRRADFEFHNDSHAARRKYKKDLDYLKPDLASYNKQKEMALGLAPGTLSKTGQSSSGASSSALTQFDPSGGQAVSSVQQQLAAESLYRDANTLLYADSKPTEDAIDKVVEKNEPRKKKFSRKRQNEDEGDITYINERNRVFNKKVRLSSLLRYSPCYTTMVLTSPCQIARYYDKYTAEIRASFERGTAL
ncbi:hypothetical protein QCA50_013202 [Cerrena zonata]|uniref:Pre-mRNA-splicing factor SYF2 n=1 Tax=Cerrena zonata TaxID=2478898 RepID=A0AAW0FSQ6_9APHY